MMDGETMRQKEYERRGGDECRSLRIEWLQLSYLSPV